MTTMSVLRHTVRKAKREELLRVGPCEVCGEERVHAHHDDYAKPLQVRWLCPTHHRQHHIEHGPGLNRPPNITPERLEELRRWLDLGFVNGLEAA